MCDLNCANVKISRCAVLAGATLVRIVFTVCLTFIPQTSTHAQGQLFPDAAVSDAVGDAPAAGYVERLLTPSDVPDELIARIHAEPESALQLMRSHASSIDLATLKSSAWSFLRVRWRLNHAADTAKRQLDALADLALEPDAWTGHPILLHGFVKELREPSNALPLEYGVPRRQALLFDPATEQPVALLDFAITGKTPELSGGFPVRASGFYLHGVELQGGSQPVQVPLIVCPELEWLSETLAADTIEKVEHNSRGIRPEEADGYYEAVMQARLLNHRFQMAAAEKQLRIRRIEYLKEAEREVARLADERDFPLETWDKDWTKANQLLRMRQHTFAETEGSLDAFPTFVDVFKSPDAWHGKLVTMRGHVRKVHSYSPDEDLLGLGRLHELWLYTEHSQRNPAVIVCSSLPDGFPVTEDVVDGVTVTGFFFKKYRYAAQDAHRLAPMLIAQRVEWAPVAAAAIQVPGWLVFLGSMLFMAVLGGTILYFVRSHQFDELQRQRQVNRQTPDFTSLNPESVPVVSKTVPVRIAPSGSSASLENLSGSEIAHLDEYESDAEQQARTFDVIGSLSDEAGWVAREQVIGKTIRAIRIPAADTRTSVEFQPATVLLSNGLHLELFESALSVGEPEHGRRPTTEAIDAVLGQPLTHCVLDDNGEAILIFANGLSVSRRSLALAEDAERFPLLGDRVRDQSSTFVDYWTEETIPFPLGGEHRATAR